MRFGFNETCLAHDPGPRHPETADRLEAIRETLVEARDVRMYRPRPAERVELETVHATDYIDEIARVSAEGGGKLDADTVASEATWDAALASAGLAIWAARDASPASDPTEIPFALGRPPGHHALGDQAMGFCFFNNSAVAAEAAIELGMAEHVSILDWDVHHGNGTQAIFLDRGDVSYASIHEEGLYPGTGTVEERGTGDGVGATLNVPLPPGAETPAYVSTMNELVLPWLARHDPDILLVSAGFDAHRHDPISRMAVDTEGFGLLTQAVLRGASSFEARVGFVLEGGYGLDTLSEGVRMVHNVCSGYDPEPVSGEPRETDMARIRTAQECHGLGS